MPAQSIERALSQKACGRFTAALETLQSGDTALHSSSSDSHLDVVAELLQLTGDNASALDLAKRVTKSPHATDVALARCQSVMAVALAERGATAESVSLFQRAMTLASEASDHEQLGWIQLHFVDNLLDILDASATAHLVEECKETVTTVGHPHLDARLHLMLAELDGKRGQLEESAAHLRAAAALLSGSENLWLEGLLALKASSVHMLGANYSGALASANAALERAGQSGHMRTRMGAIANLAYLRLLRGHTAKCEALCQEGLALTCDVAHFKVAMFETLAQVMLYESRHLECQRYLMQLDSVAPTRSEFPPSWERLSACLTRARLARDMGSWEECLAICEDGIRWSAERQDRLHGLSLQCLAADATRELGRPDEADEWLRVAREGSGNVPLAVFAEIERASAAQRAAVVGKGRAIPRFTRALRLLAEVGETGARRDGAISYVRAMKPVDQRLRAALTQKPWDLGPLVDASMPGRTSAPPVASPGDIPVVPNLTDLAPLSRLAAQARLFAQELFILIRSSGTARAVAIVAMRDGRPIHALAREGWSEKRACDVSTKPPERIVIPCGGRMGDDLSLIVQPRKEPECLSMLQTLEAHAADLVELEARRSKERVSASVWPIEPENANNDGVFASPDMKRLLQVARQIAPSDLPVLITGESGTGKEVLARFIHRHSGRPKDAFVAYNCTSAPREMVDSQLFGHRRGSFTGAHESAPGIVRGADGGTVLLDEIGDLEIGTQPKLLRLLENNEVHPIGEARPKTVHVRIIAATNADLDDLVKAGRFREDLYYRLNIVRLRIPPLRERREDILPLVRHFLRVFGTERDKPGIKLTDAALKRLLLSAWPGNARQVSNEVRRVVALARRGAIITPDLLSDDNVDPQEGLSETAAGQRTAPEIVTIQTNQPLASAVEQVERAVIDQALKTAEGRMGTAARLLGLSRKGLFLKRRRLGIDATAHP